MENKFEMVAKTYAGLEEVLVDELIHLGAENVQAGNRMVSFEGDQEILYKANLCCRTALRILKPIVKFRATDPDDLYDQVRELHWEQFLSPDSTFAVDSTVNSDEFRHSKYVTYRVKDGICDHFQDMGQRRPSVRLKDADLLLNVHISDSRVTISLDSSGEPLSHRGYRTEQTEAPLSEVLAAGIILKTGWRGDCDFADPMCGSGTFLIEAALIAANINPGIFRDNFAFERWADFDRDLFEQLYNDDSEEREFAYKIYGGDKDPEAVQIARKNIRSARVEEMIDLSCRDFNTWTDNAEEGVLVTNPPYGKRLRPDDIEGLYRSIGQTLKRHFAGWHAWILGMDDDNFSNIGLKPSQKIPVNNGGEDCMLREYVMFNGAYSDFRQDGGEIKKKSKEERPKEPKMRRNSDKEWDQESGKFNKRAGDFKERSFKRGDKKPRRDGDKPFAKRGDKPFAKQKGKPRTDRPLRPERPKPGPTDIKTVPDKGPSLSADTATVFNTVHMRRRKPKPEKPADVE